LTLLVQWSSWRCAVSVPGCASPRIRLTTGSSAASWSQAARVSVDDPGGVGYLLARLQAAGAAEQAAALASRLPGAWHVRAVPRATGGAGNNSATNRLWPSSLLNTAGGGCQHAERANRRSRLPQVRWRDVITNGVPVTIKVDTP